MDNTAQLLDSSNGHWAFARASAATDADITSHLFTNLNGHFVIKSSAAVTHATQQKDLKEARIDERQPANNEQYNSNERRL